MKIKIIKKETNKGIENKSFFQAENQTKKQNLEEKVAQNILSWVKDLREKKRFEINNAQKLLNNFS